MSPKHILNLNSVIDNFLYQKKEAVGNDENIPEAVSSRLSDLTADDLQVSEMISFHFLHENLIKPFFF